ncbi:hypothetical protein R75461_08047 [Paraburkholderia nemoris]|uniref:beta strand repeat-containing protein n=1 Tax=Paraburkholderia nemoris TaxID=2793076 RepID=UPI00190DBA41|nr:MULTISPECIES: hypothetical protein [Paraburkholderia]MBK3787001.1 hypothetical protein [Paraburkholderia aspalathi]CAE6862303.1 hypothetical protein R75461_08047 [Paraburkholderia nemoris]
MTTFSLSQNTINLINTALSDPGTNNVNYLNAYNAIYNDIKNQPGVDPGTVNWFSQAGLVNTQLFNPTPAGTWIYSYMFAAAQSEGVTLNNAIFQQVSNTIATTVFNQIGYNGGVFDTSVFSPINIVKDDAGSGLGLIQSMFPNANLDYAIWGGTLFTPSVLNDPSYYSDYNIDTSTPSTRDCQAIDAGFMAAAASTAKYFSSNASMAGNIDFQTVMACMYSTQVFGQNSGIFQQTGYTTPGSANFTPIWSDIMQTEADVVTNAGDMTAVTADAAELAAEFNVRQIDGAFDLTLNNNSIAELVTCGNQVYSADLTGVNAIYDMAGNNQITLSGQGMQATASNDQINLAANTLVSEIDGDNNTFNLASSTDLVGAIVGNNDLVNAMSGGVFGIVGTGQIVNGNGATVCLGADTSLTTNGSGLVIETASNDVVFGYGNLVNVGGNLGAGQSAGNTTIVGDASTIYAGPGDTVSVVGQGELLNGNNDMVYLGANTSLTTNGAGLVIETNGNDVVFGYGDLVNVGGNLGAGQSAGVTTIVGDDSTIYAGPGDTVAVVGQGELLNGNNDMVYLAANTSLTTNGSGLVIETNGNDVVFGYGNLVNVGGNLGVGQSAGNTTIVGDASTIYAGPGDTVSVVGQGELLNGNNDMVYLGADTSLTTNGSGLVIETASNDVVFGYGNLVNVGGNLGAGQSAGNTTIVGDASTIYAGTGDTVSVVGQGELLNGNNDMVYLGADTSLTANGSGLVIETNGNDLVAASGQQINVGGNLPAGQSGEVTTVQGSSNYVAVEYGDAASISGNANVVSAANDSAVILSGSGNSLGLGANCAVAVNGSGNSISAGAHSVILDNGVNNTINATNSVIQLGSANIGQAIYINGNGNCIDASTLLSANPLVQADIVVRGTGNTILANNQKIDLNNTSGNFVTPNNAVYYNNANAYSIVSGAALSGTYGPLNPAAPSTPGVFFPGYTPGDNGSSGSFTNGGLWTEDPDISNQLPYNLPLNDCGGSYDPDGTYDVVVCGVGDSGASASLADLQVSNLIAGMSSYDVQPAASSSLVIAAQQDPTTMLAASPN